MNLYPFEMQSIQATIEQNHRDAHLDYLAGLMQSDRPVAIHVRHNGIGLSISSFVTRVLTVLRPEPAHCADIAACAR